jgi:hypothetical protein
MFMSFLRKIVGLALILTFSCAGMAFSVGYERYDAIDSTASSKKGTRTVSYESETASFLKKCPALLDEVAFFVRDMLSQFGLANSRKP